MLWMTVPYMIGIVVADYWAGSIWPFLLSATAITVACSFFKPSRVAGWAAMLFAIGFTNQTFQIRHTPENDLRNLAGDKPLGQALLEAISPKAIVLSAGTFPYSEIPSAGLLERLAKRNVPLFNTLEDGGVEIVIHPGGLWHVESMTGRLAMGGGSAAE